MVDSWQKVITPNESVTDNTARLIIGGWVILWLAYWTLLKPVVFPTPFEVIAELPDLWSQEGLGQELMSSFIVNLEALILSSVISLPLAYLSLTPISRPVALGVSKLRFLSPAVFFLILLFATSNGHQVKVLMLTLGEMFFLVTTMVGVVASIQSDKFDDARTLRMDEWKVTWYVVVRGTIPQAIDAIRDNAAMGWSMLMMVEGFVRSEGGVGVMILNQEKHMNFAVVYCIALAVIVVGLIQDQALVVFRNWVAPYTEAAK